MTLIPWKTKPQNSSTGTMSKQAPARNEMSRFFDRFVNDPFGAINEFSPWSMGEIGGLRLLLWISRKRKKKSRFARKFPASIRKISR